MKKLYTLIALIGLIVFSSTSIAQCPNDNVQFGTSAAPTTVGVSTTLTTCLFGGEYRLVTGLVAGSSYTFATCGSTAFDSQLTIFDATTGAVLGFNDDGCGLQSTVTIVSTGANVRVSLDRFNCTNQSSCMTLTALRVNGGVVTPPNPCNSITAIVCGTTGGTFSLSGAGLFTGNGPFTTPGGEKIYSFTPTVSGSHSIAVSHTGGFYVDLFHRTQASGCSGTGWTYVDDILGSATNSVTFTAGVPVYIMIDDEDLLATNGTITITCPSLVNPCNSISTIASCGTTVTYSLPAGSGAYNNLGPFLTPGNEKIFQFTAPLTGVYDLNVTHNGGSFADIFFRTAASGCSATGWTYINDIFTSETSTVSLVGGTTYYFLMDDEDLNASSGTINITCPCIPSSTPAGSFSYDGPFTISGNTINACNNCNLRPSDDQVYAVEILCAGSYTFSTCGGAAWDTYLYLTTAFCGGTILAQNDDICGLQSSVTATLSPGTYYIHVEGFSQTSEGAFNLAVSGNLTPVQLAITGSTNVSCFGGSNGSATAAALTGTAPFNFEWNDPAGQTTATASGLTAGTYSVGGKDANGCEANAVSVTISEPTLLESSASSTAIACFGGTASVTVSATGGTAPYSGTGVYTVSAGTHSYAVTDANGCSSTVSITVSEPSLLQASASSTAIACFGETSDITVSATGGTAPYSGTGVYTVSAGTYSYTVTDANGCTSNVSITVTEPTLLEASISGTAIACFGGTSNVTVVATGGTAPYSGDGVYTVTAGTHSYTVTDANGCTVDVSITITQPTLLVASASSTVIPCFGGTSNVTVVASGGTAPYSGQGVYTVFAGTHNYTVTDANGCTANVSIVVTQPNQIAANITPQNHVIDCIPIPVTLSANPTGGTGGPYTYQWSNGATTSSITVNPNVTTTYSVLVTDGNGCTVNTSTNSTTVTVINRCGNNNQKVVICHVPHGNSGNPQTICISPNALNAHLSSLWNLHGGDYCGPCQTSSALTLGTSNNGDNAFIRAGINANDETIELSYRIGYDSDVRLEIYNMSGMLVDVVYSGHAVEGELYNMQLNAGKLSSGVYIYQFITDSETHIDKLEIIQ
jgi:SprB repeat